MPDKKTASWVVLITLVALVLVVGGTFVWIALHAGPRLTLPLVVIAGVVVLVVTLALVAVTFFLFDDCGKWRRCMPDKKTGLVVLLVIFGALVVGGTFAWITWQIKLQEAGPELTLPLIVIVGVVVLLVTLAMVAVTFSVLDLDDKTQALALPEGSVRAVIALMLLVVFAIAAIFLYSNVSSSGKIRMVEKLTTADVIELRKHVTVIFTLPPFVEPPAAGTEQAQPATPPAAGTQQARPQPATYTVYFRDLSSPAGDDIAKQLIVLLGTLVTAVASFYFGSSSVASAQAAERARRGVAGPNATSVDPSTLNAGGTSQPLTITGVNLGKVNAVKLSSADDKISIPADEGSVKASDTSVTCTVTVPADTPAGALNVVVSDNSTNQSTVPNSVSIKPATPPTQVSGGKPEAKTVEPTELKAEGSEQDLKITGTNLGKVTGVKLMAAGGKTIEATSITPKDTEVSCKVTIATGTPPGQADVVASDDAGNKTDPLKVTIS